MKNPCLAALLAVSFSVPSMAADGVIDVQSAYGVAETASRLEKILDEKGMTIFTRVDHAEGAAIAGIELRPTELIIFGNPKVGSLLMQCRQSVAIDLPQKALIWEDADSRVWISYNDPGYLQKRHDIQDCEEVLTKIGKALAGITQAAAAE